MMAVAEAGFRAIALDFRGFGLSDQPLESEKASWDDLTADVLAILDSLGVPKVPLLTYVENNVLCNRFSSLPLACGYIAGLRRREGFWSQNCI